MSWTSSSGDTATSKLTALLVFIFLAVSSAWAQTPAPTTPALGGDAAAAGGGAADYWWLIILVIVTAIIWYFYRSRGCNHL